MTSKNENGSVNIGHARQNGANATVHQAGRLVTRITKRYLLLVALFAGLSLTEYAISRRYLDVTVVDAAALNISGRQRMLSQRAALLAHQLSENSATGLGKQSRKELLAIAGIMERAHRGLTRGDAKLNLPERLPTRLRALYFKAPANLDSRVLAYLAKIRTLANAPPVRQGQPDAHAERILTSALTLLPYLDKAVQLYQADIDAKVARQKIYGTLWMVGILGLLLFFALGVFRPLRRRIERTIGESTKAAEALAESEAKYRDLIEGSVQGIIISQNLRPVFANRTAANILGYATPEALLEVENSLEMVAPEEYERIKEYSLARGRGEPAPAQYEFRARRRDGSEIWLGTQVRIVDWEGARAAQITLVDVTESKKAQLNLQTALADAEVANRAKSEFLANISHELRTPLNAILGFSEVMQLKMYGELGDKYQSYAEDIHESGQHLLSLINDIIDLSKIEAGKLSLDEEDIDLSETISACMRIVRDRAQESELDLVEWIAPDLPCLHADERALKQILLNLLSNAIKFTPAKGTVTIEAVHNADDSIRISVADTGIGIDNEQIATAWSSFGQIESAMSRIHKGAGLGLPIVRSLIELHGGTIKLDSELGVGTTVSMLFPPERTVFGKDSIVNE